MKNLTLIAVLVSMAFVFSGCHHGHHHHHRGPAAYGPGPHAVHVAPAHRVPPPPPPPPPPPRRR